MTVRSTSFEGPAGQPIAQGNHGGDEFSGPPVGSGTFDNTWASRGTCSATSTIAANQVFYDTNSQKIIIRGVIRTGPAVSPGTIPITGDNTLATAYVTTNPVLIAARLIINSASKFRIQTLGGGTTTPRWAGGTTGTTTTSSTLTVAPNTVYRYVFEVGAGPGGTGTCYAAIFSENGTTPLETSADMTGIVTSGTASTLLQGRGHFGSSATGAIRLDDFLVADGADAVRGPWVAPQASTAPVANAGQDITVDAGSPFTLTGTYTDPDANVTTRQWMQGVTVVATGDTYSGVAPITTTGTTLTYTYQVTDAAAQVGTDTVTVNVRPAGGRIRVGGTMRPYITRITVN